jgi:hypothetical protein
LGGDQHCLGIVELIQVEHERCAALLQAVHGVARLGERDLKFYSFRREVPPSGFGSTECLDYLSI